jgi:Cu/Ag efflux protein CusF
MKKTTLLVVLFTFVVFVSGIMAQGKPAPAPAKAAATPAPALAPPVKLEKFYGDIKSVDAAAKTIVIVRGKESKTFVVDEKTTITRGKDTLSLGDLKQGLNVSIEFKKEMDKLIAVTIKAGKPKGAPK